jgi:dTMP kinase
MTVKPLGKFIVLEGTDGSGTTTQAGLLERALVERGIDCAQTREPSRGPVGQLLRAALEKRLSRDDAFHGFDWATLALLFAADRMDHVRSEVEPSLQRGQWIISDRYTLSSLIYQSVTAPDPELAFPWVTELNRNARRPDLIVVLDVPKEVAEQRRAARGGPEELFDRRELQAKLADAYVSAERYSADVLVHIDGTVSVEAVAQQIWSVVVRRFLEGTIG